MSSIATSVVSAAVIGGDLILGLSDGSIINCGRVQGPQGLKGDQGPMGATGRAAPTATQFTPWRVLRHNAGQRRRLRDQHNRLGDLRSPCRWRMGTGTTYAATRDGSGEQREAIFGQTTDTGGVRGASGLPVASRG